MKLKWSKNNGQFWIEAKENNIVDIIIISKEFVEKFLVKYRINVNDFNGSKGEALTLKLYKEFKKTKEKPKALIPTVQKI